MSLFFVLMVLFAAFVLWLATIILDKAGLGKGWALCLLIPVVNIIMLWIFAFTTWPRVKSPNQENN